MAELSISIIIPDAEIARMLSAFRSRFGADDLTLEQVLAQLKTSAIMQINEMVISEEKAQLDAAKLTLQPLSLT